MPAWEAWYRIWSLQFYESLLTLLAMGMIFRPALRHASPTIFLSLESRFRHFARNKTASLIAVGFAALVLRAVLIPVLGIPEPHSHDEFSYLLAADTFAHGRLTNPAHPMWKHFETFHVIQQPTYMSMYPPAQGLVLAAGQLLGHPWIGSLIATALMCSALCWMFQGWLAPEWALLGGVLVVLRLGLLSYWVNGYWCASISAFGGALLLGSLPRLKRHPQTRDAVWMALGLGILANSRPYEGLILSVPVLVAMLHWIIGPKRPALAVLFRQVIAPLLLILAIFAAGAGYYNFRVTGKPLVLAYQVNRDQYSRARYFVWQRPVRPKPEYRYVVMRHLYEDSEFKEYLENRTVGGFIKQSTGKLEWFWRFFMGPVLTIPLLAFGRTLHDRRMRFPLAALAFFSLGLGLETWFRPHYFAPGVGLLYLVLLQCMRHLRFWRCRGTVVGPALVRAIVMVCLGMAVLRLTAIKAHAVIEDPWPRGNIARAEALRFLERLPGGQLVIVRYGPSHKYDPEWVFNAADIDNAKVVWARDMGEQDNQELLRYFKDRKVWIVYPDEKPVRLEAVSNPYRGTN
jgi:hypothetical protein